MSSMNAGDAEVQVRPTSDGRGEGLFALKNFVIGEGIFVEQPIFTCIHSPHPNGERNAALVWEDPNASSTRANRPALKSAFDELRNLPGSPLQKLNTQDQDTLGNFVVDKAFGMRPPNGTGVHTACVYRLASKINHACNSDSTPNAKVYTNYANFNVGIRARKAIASGDEILINYNRSLNFRCKCPCCQKRSFRSKFKRAAQWLKKIYRKNLNLEISGVIPSQPE